MYYFWFDIFKKGTFKGLFEKEGTLSENVDGRRPPFPPPALRVCIIISEWKWKNFILWIFNNTSNCYTSYIVRGFFAWVKLIHLFSNIFLYLNDAAINTEYWKEFSFLAKIYLFKVNNRSTRKRCEICSKLTICLGGWTKKMLYIDNQ